MEKKYIKIFFVCFISSSVVVFLYQNHKKNIINDRYIKEAKTFFKVKRDTLKQDIVHYQQDLKAVKDSKIFKDYVKSGFERNPYLDEFLYGIAVADSNIIQLRIIDTNGNEKLRIDRNYAATIPFFVDNDRLQNKAHRYYFKKSIKLLKDEFYISRFDLNVEHNNIEVPYKPVVRVATPLFVDGKKVGILIINGCLRNTLKDMVISKIFDVYIIDKEGYIVYSSYDKYNWSRYLNKNIKISDILPDEAENILNSAIYSSKKLYANALNIDNEDKLKMVIIPKQDFISDINTLDIKSILFVLFISLIFSSVVTYMFYRFFSHEICLIEDDFGSKKEKFEHSLTELEERLKNCEKDFEKIEYENKLLLSLFELGDVVLFKWKNDKEWSVEYVSASVEKLFGYTVNEFLNKEITYKDIIYKDDFLQVDKEVKYRIENELFFFKHKPYRVVTKDKQIKWVLEYIVTNKDKEGNVENFIGYILDITDLKDMI